jgi:glutamate--cysteine ligase
MIDDVEDLTKKVFNSDAKDILAFGRFGIEKESLRVSQSILSRKQHQQSMGSPLCHRYITTDFSEAQLELITPPLIDKKMGLNFLENIHHFVSHKIEDEIVWPFSMPPFIQSETEIPIASYGSSNLALFKTTYRNGLSHRYGRTMQAISGIHFNYSLPEQIWKSSLFTEEKAVSKKLRANIYFRTLRNLHRMNWLILYLFGASPIVTKNFLSNKHRGFQKLDNYAYYLPYATSLRMSDLGYQNINQSDLAISLNSLQEYTLDLKQATATKCNDFQKIDKETTEDYPQINSNILQIEDEYYAVSRPKSNSVSNQRLTTKLNDTGVDYIELRSLDINPFQRIGIDLDTVHFLEVFFIYCTLSSSPPIKNGEIEEIKQNDLLVATRGREPGLNLSNNRTKISLKNWANQILDEMMSITGLLDNKMTDFTRIIRKLSTQITDPEQTLSAMLLNKILTEKVDVQELGRALGNDYKNYYISMETSKNSDWSLLEKESADSKKRQTELEQASSQSFEDFVKEYFDKSSCKT